MVTSTTEQAGRFSTTPPSVPVTVSTDVVEGVEQITASASIKDDIVTITAANVAADKAEKVVLDIANFEAKNVAVRILAGKMDALNTFENQHAVEIADFTDFEVTEEGIVLNMPACSVVEVTVRG